MKYDEYLELGFKRTDLDDDIEYQETGYYGFCLQKKINKKLSICVDSGSLHSPRLYIKKNDRNTVIEISPQIVRNLIEQHKPWAIQHYYF